MFFLPGILSFHQLRSIPWAHQMRLMLGFLMERVTQMQTSFGRSGAEHLDLQIKDAEHLVERRTGISICLVLCNVSTHVIIAIYIYTCIRGRNVQRVSSRHGHAWTLILAPSLSRRPFLMLIHVYLNCWCADSGPHPKRCKAAQKP